MSIAKLHCPAKTIADRYDGREDYLEIVRKSAQSPVARRLLRADDVSNIVAESATRWDYLTTR